MAELPTSLEIDRLMNLVRNFGWEKTEEKIVDGKITITLQKTTATRPIPTPS